VSLQAGIAEAASAQMGAVVERLDGATERMAAAWQGALQAHERAGAQSAAESRAALDAAAAAFGEHASALLRAVGDAHARLESDAAARDERRLAATARSLESMASALRAEWQAAGSSALAQQQAVCETMERTARDMNAQAEAHAAATLAEIGRLLHAAAEAPRAAAEVVAELRAKLADSTARDNALLDERARVLETLGTLLDAVNRAATEQRGAIDGLVEASSALLDRIGERFGAQVDAEAERLADAAAQVTGGAVEVASLGEAFGHAVQLFGESNEKLGTHLQRLDATLARSLARSDEQLAYYVAQAREVIDLSMLSHRQILEDLQRVAGRAAAVEA
jgi:hypothetical protein